MQYFALVCALVITVIIVEAQGQHDVCPRIQCPMDRKIKTNCRKANFVIGSDGRTRCRVCDSDLCGPRFLVCPAIECPGFIAEECRKPSFQIGLDGITMCRMCDESVCLPPMFSCPQIECPLENDRVVKDSCRENQFVIGLDNITMCPVCDNITC